MNVVVLMGRLTKDPETRYTQGDNSMCITRYTLAVDRRLKKNGEQSADFISCVAFGRAAEFADKYFRKGMRVSVSGRIQTGSYTNRDGAKVYTTDVVVEQQEFADSTTGAVVEKQAEQSQAHKSTTDADGFMNVPMGIDEELPFN